MSDTSDSNSHSEKIIAIGDIHGCSRTLDALLDKLEAWPDHLLVFVGDYIDRGPNSKEVISRLIRLQGERECVFLRGNHEEMLLNAVDKGEVSSWLINGGGVTLQSYGLGRDNLAAFPEDHLEFIRQTELYYQTEDYFLVHAGAPVHQTLAESVADPEAEDTFLWERNHINALETPWEKTVIFGHTPRAHLIRRPKMIGIDTGCVFTSPGMGKLTALVLPEEKVVQQYSLDSR